MSREPLLKVYGHVFPVTDAFYEDLARACADALPDADDIPVLERDGDMARISFEGVYFPVDEVLEHPATDYTRRLVRAAFEIAT